MLLLHIECFQLSLEMFSIIHGLSNLLPEMGTRVLGLGLESDSSPDLAELGLESFTSGLGLGFETCGLGLDSDSNPQDSTGLAKLHR